MNSRSETSAQTYERMSWWRSSTLEEDRSGFGHLFKHLVGAEGGARVRALREGQDQHCRLFRCTGEQHSTSDVLHRGVLRR